MTIRLDANQFRHILAATFPNNHKKTVFIEPREKVTFRGLNWDGGSRDEYRACCLDGSTSERPQIDIHAPPPWAKPYNGMEIPIPEGWVIVQAGTLCGKPATPCIYCNPANMPQLIPQQVTP